MTKERNCVLPSALSLPLFNILKSNKHIILASSSPRRIEILNQFGLNPEVVPSTFPEELNHGDFENSGEYCLATATAKGVEVYQRLVRDSPEDPPDLVISADTIVVLSPNTAHEIILEKPKNELDQLGMLEDLNDNKVEVMTAVTLVQPQIASPGYSLSSLLCSTTVQFSNNPPHLLRAYIESKEGLDRAGGFTLGGRGGMLIKEIKGDYNNVLGFPGSRFFEWLGEMAEEGELCVMD